MTFRDSGPNAQGSWARLPVTEWFLKKGKRKPALYQAWASSGLASPAKPGTSGPLKGAPDRARLRLRPMLFFRWIQLEQLSPVQNPAKRLLPMKPALEIIKGRSLGRAFRKPSRLAMAMPRAYWLWYALWGLDPSLNSMSSWTTTFKAGSFMSSHTPDTPRRAKASMRLAHQP